MEDKRASSFGTPVRFLCLKNLADMVEREGDEARALELQVAAADEDGTDVAVRQTDCRRRPPRCIHTPPRDV